MGEKESIGGGVIPVNDVVRMAVLDGREELKEESSRFVLVQLALFGDVGEKLAAFAVLHHDVDSILRLDDVVELGDVRMDQLPLDRYFPSTALLLGAVHQVLLQDLDGHLTDHNTTRTSPCQDFFIISSADQLKEKERERERVVPGVEWSGGKPI